MKQRLLIVFLLLCAFFVGLFLSRKAKLTETSKRSWQTVPAPVAPAPKPRSEAELKEFWAKRMKRTFEDELLNYRYPIAEINERYVFLARKIEERYQKKLQVSMVSTFNPASKQIMAGPMIKNGIPIVELIVPALVNNHGWLVEQHGEKLGEELFEISTIVGFIHELDHLAYGYVSEDRSLDSLVELERLAWAQTCEYTLRPLVEKDAVRLGESERIYYLAWINGGRNPDSPAWRKFIMDAYAHTRK